MGLFNEHTNFENPTKALQPSSSLFLKDEVYSNIEISLFHKRDYSFSQNDMCYHILFCSRFF